MATKRRFRAVPAAAMQSEDSVVNGVLEPVRDLVRVRFQGTDRLERSPTFRDLIALGLVDATAVNQLQD